MYYHFYPINVEIHHANGYIIHVCVFQLRSYPSQSAYQTISLISSNSSKCPFYLFNLSWFKARFPTKYFHCKFSLSNQSLLFLKKRESFLTNIYCTDTLCKTLLYSLYVCYLIQIQADPGPGSLTYYILCRRLFCPLIFTWRERACSIFFHLTKADSWVSKNA